jgi:hypothetical protein
MRLGPQLSSLLILSGLWSTALGYQPPSPGWRRPQQLQQQQQQQLKHKANGHTMDRSTWIRHVALMGLSITAPLSILPTRALADDTTTVAAIQDATQTLQTLLDNWENAVIDCTFADVPRELLADKNKEELLEKAKTSALFDKSASIVTCKTTNRRVRNYIGATGKGPVVGLEKNLRKALDLVVDPDKLDVYVQGIEDVQQSLAKATSLSYMSGVADFNAVNNFKKDDIPRVLSSDSNLEQARGAIRVTVQGLNEILALLPPS